MEKSAKKIKPALGEPTGPNGYYKDDHSQYHHHVSSYPGSSSEYYDDDGYDLDGNGYFDTRPTQSSSGLDTFTSSGLGQVLSNFVTPGSQRLFDDVSRPTKSPTSYVHDTKFGSGGSQRLFDDVSPGFIFEPCFAQFVKESWQPFFQIDL